MTRRRRAAGAGSRDGSHAACGRCRSRSGRRARVSADVHGGSGSLSQRVTAGQRRTRTQGEVVSHRGMKKIQGPHLHTWGKYILHIILSNRTEKKMRRSSTAPQQAGPAHQEGHSLSHKITKLSCRCPTLKGAGKEEAVPTGLQQVDRRKRSQNLEPHSPDLPTVSCFQDYRTSETWTF